MQKPLIMLVDDEIPFVETMVKRLEKREFTVIPAFNGHEAIELLDKNRNTDVVLLDVKMPGIDGIQTLKQIKNKYPLVEVIMLTGHATVESAIDGMKVGAFDYLMKPCDIENITLKINEAIQKRREHEKKIQDAKVKEVLATHGM